MPDWMPAAIVAFVMVLDVVSGFAAAVYNSDVQSGKMRKGLISKSEELILVAMAWLVGIAPDYIKELPDELSVVYDGVCAYILVTEMLSILENICEAVPSLRLSKLMSIFGIDKDGKEGKEDD